MLVGVQVQHEVDQRALELRAGPHQDRESRAGDLGGALEINDAELGTEIPVRFRLEVEAAGIAPGAHDLVVGRALPHRHAAVRDVRQRLEQARALLLDRLQLDIERLDLLAALLVRLEDVRDVNALLLGARHLFARRVLLALERFGLLNEAPPIGLRRGQGLQLGRHVEAAVGQAGLYRFNVVANEVGIEHAVP